MKHKLNMNCKLHVKYLSIMLVFLFAVTSVPVEANAANLKNNKDTSVINSLEWLVHTGWYSSLIYEDGVYRMPEIWVAASTATYLYRFTYEGM